MSFYEKYIAEPVAAGYANPGSGIPTPLPKLAKFTNYIERGKNVVISGRETSGKKSYMDYVYFLNVFKWWRDLDMPEEMKPPIHFYYFNMTGREKVLFQKWFCLVQKIELQNIMDIPTLNSSIGRMRDLSETDLNFIRAGQEFMEDLEKHLTVISAPQTPSDIYNFMRREMDKIGSFDENHQFHLDEAHRGQLTFMYINDADRLLPETDGFAMLNAEGLKKRLSTYLRELRDDYKINNVWVSPTKDGSPRSPKATEPTYKDLGGFYSVADLGVVLYNPFNEGNNKYQGYPINDLVIRGKNRFRTLTVVRNENGPENITVGLIFLGECGYFRESPIPTAEEEWNDLIVTLRT